MYECCIKEPKSISKGNDSSKTGTSTVKTDACLFNVKSITKWIIDQRPLYLWYLWDFHSTNILFFIKICMLWYNSFILKYKEQNFFQMEQLVFILYMPLSISESISLHRIYLLEKRTKSQK